MIFRKEPEPILRSMFFSSFSLSDAHSLVILQEGLLEMIVSSNTDIISSVDSSLYPLHVRVSFAGYKILSAFFVP